MRAGLATGPLLGMEIKVRLTDPRRRQRFALLVTKEPHCFEAIARAAAKSHLWPVPPIVIGNHPA